MRYIIINIILLTLLLGFATSCQKSKQNKLIGTWESQPMSNTTVESSTKQYWTFDSAANLTVADVGSDTTITLDGIYSMSSKNMGISGYYIQITNVSGVLDGKYKIKQLDGSKLSLHRIELADGNTAGAFLWRDFLKKE